MPEGRVKSFSIVPSLYERVNGRADFFARFPLRAMDQFRFYRGVKAFDWSIIPAVSLAAHATDNPVVTKQFPIGLRCILASTIGMIHEPTDGLASNDGHSQCIESERFVDPVAHRPANNSARPEVDDDGEVKPAFIRGDVGYVTCPNAIDRFDVFDPEASAQHISCDRMFVLRICRRLEFAANANNNGAGTHQAGDPLTTDGNAIAPKGRMDPRAAVRLPTKPMHHLDLGQQTRVGLRAFTRFAGDPCIVAGSRNLEKPVHHADTVFFSIAMDAGEPHLDSRAKTFAVS